MTNARPFGLLNGQGQFLPQSFKDLAYQGDLNGGASLVYVGFARPGSSTLSPVWQIFKIGYSGSAPISITWPINSDGIATNDFTYVWNDRATYTYA